MAEAEDRSLDELLNAEFKEAFNEFDKVFFICTLCTALWGKCIRG